MIRRFFASILVMIVLSPPVTAVMINTTGEDSTVLESIQGFDAGSLGLVDIDFGGNTFNAAFGSEPVPGGFLFAESAEEALAITGGIRGLLNDYNSTSENKIFGVKNSVPESERQQSISGIFDVVSFIDVAYDVQDSTAGIWQTEYSDFFGQEWRAPFWGETFDRDSYYFVFARMTRSSATPVPEPGSLTLLVMGLVVIGMKGLMSRSK